MRTSWDAPHAVPLGGQRMVKIGHQHSHCLELLVTLVLNKALSCQDMGRSWRAVVLAAPWSVHDPVLSDD